MCLLFRLVEIAPEKRPNAGLSEKYANRELFLSYDGREYNASELAQIVTVYLCDTISNLEKLEKTMNLSQPEYVLRAIFLDKQKGVRHILSDEWSLRRRIGYAK
jgi:hypothetical protein